MTELSFLLDLLINQKLYKETKEVILKRIKEIEVQIAETDAQKFETMKQQLQTRSPRGSYPGLVNPVVGPAAEQPTVIAHTPEAAAALVSRQEAINASINRKIDGSGRPRKF